MGAGITGLATALELARRGADVVVLEAARAGAGASARSGGIALEGTSQGALPGATDCLAHLERLLEREAIECGLRLGGCWELAHGREGRPLWRDAESELRVADTVPGGTLDPARLVDGLVRAARAHGARICEGRAVTRLERGRVEVGGRTLSAERTVVALNAYTSHLLRTGERLASALTVALRTAPVERAAAEAAGLASELPFYTVDRPYLWGRSLPRGRLAWGAGLAPDGETPLERRDIDGAGAAELLDSLEARVRQLHPALGRLRFERRWGGPVAFRSGGVPFLCRLASAPEVVATGAYAGHGIALGARIGAHIAAALLDGATLPGWGSADLALRSDLS